MHFKAHRCPQLPLTHLMLSSLLWLYSSPIRASKKASTFPLIQNVCGTLSLYTSKLSSCSKEVRLIYHAYNPWSAAEVSSKCVWEDVICTDSATVTGLCQAGCSKMAWTVGHPGLVPKHFAMISSSLNETISSTCMETQDYISLWLCATIFHLTWKHHMRWGGYY